MSSDGELSSNTSSSFDVESLYIVSGRRGKIRSFRALSSRVLKEGDVTEEDEDDEDGIRFATLETRKQS